MLLGTADGPATATVLTDIRFIVPPAARTALERISRWRGNRLRLRTMHSQIRARTPFELRIMAVTRSGRAACFTTCSCWCFVPCPSNQRAISVMQSWARKGVSYISRIVPSSPPQPRHKRPGARRALSQDGLCRSHNSDLCLICRIPTPVFVICLFFYVPLLGIALFWPGLPPVIALGTASPPPAQHRPGALYVCNLRPRERWSLRSTASLYSTTTVAVSLDRWLRTYPNPPP